MTDEATRLRLAPETLTQTDEEAILPYARDLCGDQLIDRSVIWAVWEAMKKLNIATPQSTGRTDSERLDAIIEGEWILDQRHYLNPDKAPFAIRKIRVANYLGWGQTAREAIDTAMDNAKGGE